MRITIHDRDPQGERIKGAVWFRGAESMIAGAGAGLVSSVVTCPLDVVKTKLQAGGANAGRGPSGLVGQSKLELAFLSLLPLTHSLTHSLSSLSRALSCTLFYPCTLALDHGRRYALRHAGTAKHIWLNDGFRGFYRGLGPTIIGYLPTWAIYFTMYDLIKQRLSVTRGQFAASFPLRARARESSLPPSVPSPLPPTPRQLYGERNTSGLRGLMSTQKHVSLDL